MHWQQVSTSEIPVGPGATSSAGISFIVYDPSSAIVGGKSQMVYAGVEGQGIYKSIDGGTNWDKILGGADNATLVPQQAEFNANGELIITYSNSNPDSGAGQIWRLNSGNTWQNISPSSDGNFSALAVDPNNHNTMYAATYRLEPDNIWRSTDGGDTWTKLNNTLSENAWNPSWSFYTLTGDIAVNPENPNELWLTNGMGVWKTIDGDKNNLVWTIESTGIEEVVTFDGVSTPGGASLIKAIADFNGIRYADTNSLSEIPTQTNSPDVFSTTISIAYSYNNPNFIVSVGANHHEPWNAVAGYSTDNGVTWNKFESFSNGGQPSDLAFGNIAVSATNTQSMIWQGTNWANPYYTLDGGKSWNEITFFNSMGGAHTHLWNTQQILAADGVDGETFYMYHHVDGGLYRTDDGGVNWTKASTLPSGQWFRATLITVPGQEGDVWVDLNTGLYHSTDKGVTFTKIPNITNVGVIGFGKEAPDSAYKTIYLQGTINGQNGVFGSIDDGVTWHIVSGLPTDYVDAPNTLVGDMNEFGRVYLGTGGNGFIYGTMADPNAVSNSLVISQNDVLSNDSDPNNDTLQISSFSQALHGSVQSKDGNFVYTPNLGYSGADSFTYTVSDGNGGTNTATINLTVNAANKAPTLTGDRNAMVNEAGRYFLTSSDLGALDSDSNSFTYNVSGLNASISIQKWNGSAWSNVNSFTNTDLSNDLIAIKHNTGETIQTFNVSVSDGFISSPEKLFTVYVNSSTDILNSDFLVPTSTSSWQYDSQIVSLNNGGYIVTWEDAIGYNALKGKVLTAEGAILNSRSFAK